MTTLVERAARPAPALESIRGQYSHQEATAPWLKAIRKAAWERFLEAGFPTHKHEGWRQTNLAPILQREYKVRRLPQAQELTAMLAQMNLPAVDGSEQGLRLVFVNGHFVPGMSNPLVVEGLRYGSLAPLLHAEDSALRKVLEAETDLTRPLVALNTAFLGDGAFVGIAPGAVIEQPISILHLTTGDNDAPGLCLPRTVVVAGKGAKAAVQETFAGPRNDIYFTNSLTQVVAAADAQVEYTQLNQQSPLAGQVSELRTRQGKNSRLAAHSFVLGGALVRNNVHAILDGEGAECLLNGLFALSGSQHVDNSTVLDHAQPLGTSREYYKGILGGKSVGVFNGRIIVRPGAQHTDAIQSNKNLLLSDAAATLSSQPQLEIYADDVRCTHGATVGQLDDNAYFYLRSRGLGEAESRRLLVYAFAADVLGRIQEPGLRSKLERMLFAQWTTPENGRGRKAKV